MLRPTKMIYDSGISTTDLAERLGGVNVDEGDDVPISYIESSSNGTMSGSSMTPAMSPPTGPATVMANADSEDVSVKEHNAAEAQSEGSVSPLLPSGGLEKEDATSETCRQHDSVSQAEASDGQDVAPVFGGLLYDGPDPDSIITHFDIVHHHMDRSAATTQRAVLMAREDCAAAIGRKHEEAMILLNKHKSEIEEGISELEGKVEKLSKPCQKIITGVQKVEERLAGGVVEKLDAILKSNAELSSTVNEISVRMRELERKLEAITTLPDKYQRAGPAMAHGRQSPQSPTPMANYSAATSMYPIVSPPASRTMMPWAAVGIPVARHQLHHMDTNSRRAYFANHGHHIGTPDLSQHPAYHNGAPEMHYEQAQHNRLRG